MPEISEFDQEFLTPNNMFAEEEKLNAMIQQNLTSEEQAFIEKYIPVVSQFMNLIAKAQGVEQKSPLDEQEMPIENNFGPTLPEDMQSEVEAPLQPVQGKMTKAALGRDQQNAPEQEAGQVAAGPIGIIDAEGADNSGVADDVPTESDGFVINAAAVRKIGVRKIYDLIEEAITYLEEKGVNLDTAKVPMDAEKILVSKGEVVIPDVVAAVIGYDRLDEINDLGIDETKELLAEEPTGKPPILEAASGLNVNKEQNKELLLNKDMQAAQDSLDIESQIQQQNSKKKPMTMEQEIQLNKALEEDKTTSYHDKKYKPSKKIGGEAYTISDPDQSINYDVAINEVWSTAFNPTKAIRGPKFDAATKSTENVVIQQEVLDAIPKGMAPFKQELKALKLYTPSLFEHFARKESMGGEKRIGVNTQDQGVFMLNLDNFDRLVNPNNKKYNEADWNNFKKIWGPLAAQTHGMDSDQLKEFWLSNPEEFKDRNLNDISFNLSMVIAVTLLPNKNSIKYMKD